jgi:hypothetical protein
VRQKESDEAERTRLDRQLAHDRVMRDVAELRALLDESLHAAGEVGRSVDALLAFARQGSEQVPRELADRSYREMRDLQMVADRLNIRLGREHELTQLYLRHVKSLQEYAAVVPLPRGTSEERAAYDDAISKINTERLRTYIAYVDRCVKEVGFFGGIN